ncbi:MAG: type 2 isopentenyl-diphosphate Delta-isomerase [Bacillota bacterium]|nr:type 2 isopentenyl-diphosphate Delta-isomerase [Bacillota bacterium]
MSNSEQRKKDHVSAALSQKPSVSPFGDFQLIHRCIPELSLKEVDLRVSLFGFCWGAPLYINAMTGGYGEAEKVNESLGALADKYQIPIAVGSQKAALRNPALRHTFTSIRKRNPKGMIWSNLSAGSSVAEVATALDMINAQALQLHLNAPQELAMPEGDRDFGGWLENIASTAKAFGVPIIAKEVGFGIAKEDALLLTQTAIAALDIGGTGGTDFLRIEQSRHTSGNAPLEGVKWGTATPISLVESLAVTHKPIFASGGVDSPMYACICLALGASAIGVGRSMLRVLLNDGEDAADAFLRRFIDDMRLILTMQGCHTIAELQQRPVVITGKAREWLDLRGLAPERFARRGQITVPLTEDTRRRH